MEMRIKDIVQLDERYHHQATKPMLPFLSSNVASGRRGH